MSALGVVLVVVLVASVFTLVVALFWRDKGPRYRAIEIMTGNELEFFGRLRRALPHYFIFPQVSMAALIAPTAFNSRTALIDFRRISQKRVDYAVFTHHMKLVAIVELDDRSHDRLRDAIRDQYFTEAGVRTGYSGPS